MPVIRMRFILSPPRPREFPCPLDDAVMPEHAFTVPKKHFAVKAEAEPPHILPRPASP